MDTQQVAELTLLHNLLNESISSNDMNKEQPVRSQGADTGPLQLLSRAITWLSSIVASPGRKHARALSLSVLVPVVGMLLAGCGTAAYDAAGSAAEAENMIEAELENDNAASENPNEAEDVMTLADQLVGTWSLEKSEVMHHPHYYRQFTEDGVTCFDASVDWLGKLPAFCASYSLEGNIMTLTCPEDGGSVCHSGAICTYEVTIREGNTITLEPDTESCSAYWKSKFGTLVVDVPELVRVGP